VSETGGSELALLRPPPILLPGAAGMEGGIGVTSYSP
jgi:hypothetical protein